MNYSSANFLKLRKHIGLTQYGISKEIEITRSTVGAIEEGRAKVSVEIFFKLVEIGLLTNEEMFDFYFNPKFVPKTLVFFIKETVRSSFQKLTLNKNIHDRINHHGSH